MNRWFLCHSFINCRYFHVLMKLKCLKVFLVLINTKFAHGQFQINLLFFCYYKDSLILDFFIPVNIYEENYWGIEEKMKF